MLKNSYPSGLGQQEWLRSAPNPGAQARIAAGLTQGELAQRLGIKSEQVYRLESKHTNKYATASLERLQSIALALKVTMRIEIKFDPSA